MHMKEFKLKSETVIEVNSLQEALAVDTEMKDVNIIILDNVTTKGKWKEPQEQSHIPKEIANASENFGKIIMRVGLGYHYLYDTIDKSWVKPLDTSTKQVINKYIAEK